MTKKNEKKSPRPVRVLDSQALRIVAGGLNFTKITY